MKPTMNKTLLAVTLGLTFNMIAPATHASLVLTFTDSAAAAAILGACSGIGWVAGAEFRFCDPTGVALQSGSPLQKDAIVGGETWAFNDAGQMTGVTGTPGNPVIDPSLSGSAAPTAGTNPSLQQAVPAYGPLFYFLAPTMGSLAGERLRSRDVHGWDTHKWNPFRLSAFQRAGRTVGWHILHAGDEWWRGH